MAIVKAKTENGWVRGVPAGAQSVSVFKGVPFAAPPVGELRWARPQRHPDWEGVRDCIEFSDIPWQRRIPDDSFLSKEFYPFDWDRNEDCLYLNIWTPAKQPGEKLPVAMWIFGGGNFQGYGHKQEFDGEAYARRGIVYVSINYRLNVFGFMSHPELTAEQGASGNYGLLDQLEAIKWLHRNIEAFGGDPDNISIFGQSGGGRSQRGGRRRGGTGDHAEQGSAVCFQHGKEQGGNQDRHLLAVRRHPDQRALPRDQQRGAVRQAARRPERDGLGACELLHRQRGGEEVMAGTNRTGRVSAIDYKAGTYEVTYFDRGKSVTRQINAISNGEYKMPSIGQVVSVSHNSNGAAAGTTTGTVWNKTNTPAEGYKGLFRKEYAARRGLAYERYDENTGVYTQYVNRRTGRTCNGEIYDEAKGAISLVAGGQFQAKSSAASMSLNAKTGVGIVAGTTVSIEAGTFVSIEAAGALSVTAGGKYTFAAKKGTKIEVEGGDAEITINGATVKVTEAGDVEIGSSTKISLTAPEINATAASGDITINGVSLVNHTHMRGAVGKPDK